MIEALQAALAIEAVKAAVMWAVLLLIVGFVFTSLRARSRSQDSRISLDDLLLDDNGKMEPAKAVFIGSFLFSVWMMVYLTVSGAMTEGYFGIFNGAWVTPIVARVVFGKREPPTVEKADA